MKTKGEPPRSPKGEVGLVASEELRLYPLKDSPVYCGTKRGDTINIVMNQYQNISPLDFRYRIPELEPYFTEEACIQYQLKVEVTLAKIFARYSICSQKVYREIAQAAKKITAAEVYKEDQKTKHTPRAMVNCLQRRISSEARRFVHLGATSSDIYDTANAMRLRDATRDIILPDLIKFEKQLIKLALKEKDTLQIGRTHGQHAVPITFGFALAEYISRLGNTILEIKYANDNLKGQFSGATGSYNALSLITPDPQKLEREVLAELSLSPASHSTQIVEPEFLANHTHSLTLAFGVIANFVRDMRHLQRTEIAEIGEGFSKQQVGSSTMPHKRNPVTFEHVEGLWKELMPRMITLYLDQVSEHQRDLSNYSSSRFVFEIAHGLDACVRRLHTAIDNLVVNREKMKQNFQISNTTIIAEPLYILLALAGHPNAHEAVRELTLRAEKEKVDLPTLLNQDKKLKSYLTKIPPEKLQFLSHPEKYIGLAPRKTEQVCKYWLKRIV